jgi:hypothetical protein
MQKGTEAFALPTFASPINACVDGHEMPSGFRHFLATPKSAQRFKAYGIDPLTAPDHCEKIRTLMNRLSRRMDAQLHWPVHGDATIEHWENPGIPSGYTYLLQFVAHDLVHSAIPLSVTGVLGADTANARHSGLKLCMATVPLALPLSMRRTRQTMTVAPSCGLAACAGTTRRLSPVVRSATSRGLRPRMSPGSTEAFQAYAPR